MCPNQLHVSSKTYECRNNFLYSTSDQDLVEPFLKYRRIKDSNGLEREVKDVLCIPEHFEGRKNEVMTKARDICMLRIDGNMLRDVRESKRRIIAFGFLSSDQPNARASCVYEKYAILINDGVVPLLWSFWQRAMERPANIISIDDLLNKERTAQIGVDTMLCLWDMVGREGFTDNIKEYGVWEFVRYGLEFLVDHEFAHIFRGHLPMIQKGEFAEISELEDGQQEEVPFARQMQAFELDADAYAADKALSSFKKRYRKARRSPRESEDYRVYQSLENSYRSLCLCLYLIPRFHSSHIENILNMRTLKHPPTFIRYMRIISVLESFYRKNLKPSENPLEDHPVIYSEMGYCDVTGNPFDNSIFTTRSTEEMLSYSLEIMRKWEDISGRFEHLANWDFHLSAVTASAPPSKVNPPQA